MAKLRSSIVKTVSLVYHKSTSHKFYDVELHKLKTGYKVLVRYGRIGGFKNSSGSVYEGYTKNMYYGNISTLQRSVKRFEKLVKDKLIRGYKKARR